ncbi:ABC transporter ATP-binding protein [Homoserinimonas sp. A447]
MNGELSARVIARRGTFLLDASINVAPGEVLALLGPNGAGKSTLLQVVAGLLIPERGEVAVAGRTLTRRGSSTPVFVPPRHRGVGLLGQDPLLFPHLSAAQNVAFSVRAQGIRPAQALAAAEQWLAAVGLEGLENRKPDALSGGQQQRVAIARVLAARPAVLLLDEPMAALDVQTAAAIRALLKERLADTGIPAVLVSHNVLDAIVLADRVAILDEGRIVEEGDTGRLVDAPVTQFARDLVGTGPVSAIAGADGSVRLEVGAEPGERVWIDILSR